DVGRGDERGGQRARHQVPARVPVVTRAHVAVAVEDVLVREDAVGGDEVLHERRVGRPRGGGRGLRRGPPAPAEHGRRQRDPALEPKLSPDELRALYRAMILGRRLDERMVRLQRQGRLGTFAPIKGQEASQLGSVSTLRPTDWMVPSFRETAAMLWRGWPIE